MFELTSGAEVLGLSDVESVSPEEMAALWRGFRHRATFRRTTCLITLDNSANGISILNILNGLGGL